MALLDEWLHIDPKKVHDSIDRSMFVYRVLEKANFLLMIFDRISSKIA